MTRTASGGSADAAVLSWRMDAPDGRMNVWSLFRELSSHSATKSGNSAEGTALRMLHTLAKLATKLQLILGDAQQRNLSLPLFALAQRQVALPHSLADAGVGIFFSKATTPRSEI